MSTQTRWPYQGNTNELVAVMLLWEFAGAADLTRTPMIVDGQDQSASIQGTGVTSVTYTGVPGYFRVNLRDGWPWLLGDDLKITTPGADGNPAYTVKAVTDLTYQQGTPTVLPYINLEVFDAAGVLANPPAGHTLRGSLTFRNRKTGS